MKHQPIFLFLVFLIFPIGSCNNPNPKSSNEKIANTLFSLDELQKRTFLYFWEQIDSGYQTLDRFPTLNFSSIAATGFGLTSYLIGAERGYITRAQAAERVRNTLIVLKELPQNTDPKNASGYKGFFYHFLTLNEVRRFKDVELSTIDTGLLMAGILSTMSYFDGENAIEKEIRTIADLLYRRVEWDWFLNEKGYLSMGWHPERDGFLDAEWSGYNEAMILILLAMASPTHPIPEDSWEKWCQEYKWGSHNGFEYLNFHALFGHQYSQMYIDFRGIQDDYMRTKGIDYFENSRRATYANRAYCMENPLNFTGYSENCWGLTACDGPNTGAWESDFGERTFRGYSARGPSSFYTFDDGTIAPTAAGGSIPFASEICMPVLKNMWENYHDSLIGKYGFKDAFNLTFTYGKGNENGWFDKDYIGIDQGVILIQIENHRSEFVWNLMKKNPYIIEGLKKAGFKGAWLKNE